MKRSIISMIGVMAFCGIGLTASSAMAIDGPLANATVSFGQWEPRLDRFSLTTLDVPAGGASNNHELIPNIVKIKAGGAVNFIISGLHIPAIYGDGTEPEEIDRTLLSTTSPAGGVINDTTNRIYRGLNASLVPLPRDRVEVVQFSNPGTYLVICALRNHFFNQTTQQFEMFGYVTVLPGK
jgi:hypothetical protein